MNFLKCVLICLVFTINSFAQEPAYCDPKIFLSKESTKLNTLIRDHIFKFDDTIILGAAVGLTPSLNIIAYATNNSNVTSAENYCTWYFNEGNENATVKFNHFYVENPKNLTVTSGPAEYRQILQDQFAKSSISFLSCIEQHKYLAMGCNGQMHRGPTVFGMLLSFSGCSATQSAKIVNSLWGLNGVKAEVRLAIIEEGYKLGNEDPDARLRMQKAFGY